MARTAPFQGERARARGGTGRDHVVEQQDEGGNRSLRAKGRFDVASSGGLVEPRLGRCPGDAGKERRVAPPPGLAGEGDGDQGGQVEAPNKVFQRVDGNRDDERPAVAGEEPAPSAPDAVVRQTPCQRLGRGAQSAVLDRPDGLARRPLVGEERKGGERRFRSCAGGARRGGSGCRAGDEIAAQRALAPVPGRPAGDGGRGKIDRRGREQRAKRGGFGEDGRRGGPGGFPENDEGSARRLSERWPALRSPCGRARWRRRPIGRKRGSGPPT